MKLVTQDQCAAPGCVNASDEEAHNRCRVSCDSREELFLKIVTQMVAIASGLDRRALMEPNRGKADISRARQVSCYLLNTSLSFSLVQIGRLFHKDRTTIGHACRLVEDQRDEPDFDDFICQMEAMIMLIKTLADETLEIRDDG